MHGTYATSNRMSDSDHAASPVAPDPASPAAAKPASDQTAGAAPATVAPATISGDLCPYCGEFSERPADVHGQPVGTPRCRACLAFLDPLSKQVTQGHMGPWSIRDTTRPFYPGVGFEVLAMLIARGEVTKETVIRGPGTGQFWMHAGRTPGVAHLLGACHACGAQSLKGETRCGVCAVAFPTFPERDRLGLPGAHTPKRISAFASDEELRASPAGQRAMGVAPTPMAPTLIAAPRPQRDASLSPLELSLGVEVATERKKTLWLMVVIALLVVVNLAIAAWAILGSGGRTTKPQGSTPTTAR